MNKKCIAATLIVLAFALIFPPVGVREVYDYEALSYIQNFDFTGFEFILSTLNERPTTPHEVVIFRYDLLLLEVLTITFFGLGVSLIVGD